MSAPLIDLPQHTHRSIVPNNVRRFVELRQNVLRKHLSELDTHLVCMYTLVTSRWERKYDQRTKGIDAPDDALGKDFMFVQSNERAERPRS